MQTLENKISKMLHGVEENPSLALVILLVVSLLIKSQLIYQTDIINTDGIRYINSAHQLFQGNITAAFSHEKMLGFTFLLGLTQMVIPDWFLAGKILSCLALVLTTIPLYLIAHQLFGRRSAFFTALVFTILPSVNGKCTSVIKDPVFLFLLMLSLWLVLYAVKQSRWWPSLIAGLLCCLSVLVRPEGVVFFSVITLFLMFSAVLLPESRRPAIRNLAAFCVLPFAIFLLIVILFLTGVAPAEVLPKIYTRFALYFQTDLMQVYGSIYQHLKAVEDNFPGGQWTNDFFEYARYNIYLVYLVGMLQTFCKTLFPVFLLPLIFGLKLKGHWNRHLALLLVVLGSFLLMDYLYLMSRNFLSARYLLVPVVLSLVLVGFGMDRMISSILTLRHRRVVAAVAIVLCLLLPLGKTLVKNLDEKTELEVAGVWLRDHRDMTTDRIIVNEERIAYYAGLFRGDYDIFRGKSVDALEEKALQGNRRMIVLYMNRKDSENMPEIKGYTLVERFPGRKKIAMIYERKT